MLTLHVSNDLLVGGRLKELREEGEVRDWPVVAEVEWIKRCLFEDRSDGCDLMWSWKIPTAHRCIKQDSDERWKFHSNDPGRNLIKLGRLGCCIADAMYVIAASMGSESRHVESTWWSIEDRWGSRCSRWSHPCEVLLEFISGTRNKQAHWILIVFSQFKYSYEYKSRMLERTGVSSVGPVVALPCCWDWFAVGCMLLGLWLRCPVVEIDLGRLHAVGPVVALPCCWDRFGSAACCWACGCAALLLRSIWVGCMLLGLWLRCPVVEIDLGRLHAVGPVVALPCCWDRFGSAACCWACGCAALLLRSIWVGCMLLGLWLRCPVVEIDLGRLHAVGPVVALPCCWDRFGSAACCWACGCAALLLRSIWVGSHAVDAWRLLRRWRVRSNMEIVKDLIEEL